MSINLTTPGKATLDTAYQMTAWEVVEATTATTDLDLSLARNFRVIMLADTTINFISAPPDQSLYDVNIRFHQQGAANYQVLGYTVNGGAFTNTAGVTNTGLSGAVILEDGTGATTYARAEIRYTASDIGSYTPAGTYIGIYKHWNWNRIETATATATTVNLDLAGSRQFDLTLATAAVNINLINLPVAGEQYQFALRVRQDSGGSRTIGGWRVEAATATPNYVDSSTFALNSTALAVTEITGRVANISGSYSVWLGKTDAPSAGGLTYFTEARSTAAPNGTVPAHSFAATGAEANVDAVFSPKGTGAVLAVAPDNGTTGGNKRGTSATDWQITRTAADSVASGNYSTIGGGRNNKASDSAATVAGGVSCYATSTYTAIGGGNSNSATANSAVVAGGSGNAASGQFSSIVGGSNNAAGGDYAVIPGGYQATTRTLYGRMSFASGQFAGGGDAQIGIHVLRRQTTDATLTQLTSSTGVASTSNTPVLPNNHAYIIRASIVARDSGTGDTKAWTIDGAVRRGANAAATALVGTQTKTVVAADAGAATWDCNLVANTTRGSAEIEVTGEAAKTIRWVCRFETVEVG